MAVQKKGNGPSPKVLNEMGETLIEQIGDLWKTHIKEAVGVLEQSEEPTINLAFGVKLNFKESAPKLTTSIRFTQSYTDERVNEFEDPDQMPLGTVSKEAKGRKSAGD